MNIPVTTSEFTSMISRVHIGQPSQLLYMSLSFDSKASYIYPRDNCQQFVTCFDSKNSATYHWVGADRDADFQRKINGPVVADEVSFGEDAPIEEEFVSVSLLPNDQLVARDTAGQLSLGPSGNLLSNTVLEIKVDNPTNTFASKQAHLVPNWSLRMFLDETPQVPDGCVSERFRVHPNRISWQAPARILVGDSIFFNHTQVVFAPNIDDIVIPKKHYQSVLDELLLDDYPFLTGPDDRLYAECLKGSTTANTLSMRPLRIKSISPRSNFITILPEHLGYYGKRNFHSNKARDGKRFCPTRILFQAGDFPIKLGLPFFASVESVVFDEPSHEVTVSFVRNRLQRTAALLTPVVPVSSVFANPYVVEYDSVASIIQTDAGGFKIEFSNGWQSVGETKYNLILSSVSPRTSDVGTVMTVEFVFVKKFKSIFGSHTRQAVSRRDFEGLYHMKVRRALLEGGTNQEEATVTFGFEKARDPETQSFKVQMIDEPNNVIIRLTKIDTIVELESYNISAPIEFDAAEWPEGEEAECSICRDTFEDGDEIQKLEPVCQHCYHVRCIKVWLESNRECCLCRTKIPYRDDLDTVVVKATTASPEPSDDESEEGES